MFGQSNENSWKEKYLEALEELESKEQSWLGAEELLRRSVARVAIAASGVDQRMDAPLKLIRSSVNSKLNAKRLESGLEDLANSLRRMEAAPKPSEGTSRPEESTQESAELESKGRAAKPADDESNSEDVVKRVSELARALPVAANEAEQVVARIQSVNPVTLERVLDELRQGLTPLLTRLSAAQAQEPREPTDDLSLVPLLVSFIDRVAISPEMSKAAASVRSQLESGVCAQDWGDVLEELADVVAGGLGAIRAEKQELEDLFEQIAQQLAHLESFVDSSRSNLQASRDSGAELEEAVTARVTDIREEVDRASDVKALRDRIQRSLSGISEQIGSFRDREEARLEDANAQNDDLAQRIGDLEFETSALRERCKQQQTQLMLDPLTQVHSRFAYDHRIAEEHRRWQRYQRPSSYAIWDVDHFKSVNDTYGHKAGDRALCKLAQFVRANIREGDFLARVGGEEFVIVMPGLASKRAAEVIEKLRRRIEIAGFNYGGKRVPITVSFGITQFRDDDDSNSIFERADQALYRAKSEGRNRCVTV